jgi:hypothetical protein
MRSLIGIDFSDNSISDEGSSLLLLALYQLDYIY